MPDQMNVDARLRLTIGDLVIQTVIAQTQAAESAAKIAELTKELEMLRAGKIDGQS